FYDTVHEINAKDYTKDQLDVWATGFIDKNEWNRSFLLHRTMIVEDEDKIVGFADMDETGYLDRLYVHKDVQGKGVATMLCDFLEKGSKSPCLITHASISAKGFFEHRGYRMVKEQLVERNGVYLKNYVMKKEN
ncbi:MAG: GNAT family N-acetyltransferase, partial [Longicatena sp.]